MNDFYRDDALVTSLTQQACDEGVTILQIWKRGRTNKVHCQFLLDLFSFKPDSHVLDIGCGVGAVARTMADLRPDLRFSLQNLSAGQMGMIPLEMPWQRGRYLGDMTSLAGVPDQMFDAAMCNYALGHTAELQRFLCSVARVLKPGGVLCVYDVLPLPGNEYWAWSELGYHTHDWASVSAAAFWAGFEVSNLRLNVEDLNLGEFELVCDPGMTAEVERRTRPVCYRFARLDLRA